MEADLITKRKWEDIETGRRRRLVSFISANNASGSFGSFRLCKSVHNEFGMHFTGKLMFRCGNCIWKGNYDAEKMRFYGFRKFMRYYRLTIFSMIRFDYYGDEMFKVQIFKPNAIECDRPTYEVKEFMTNDNFQIWNQDEFMFDGANLEFEKNVGIWAFNSYRNYPEYYSTKIYRFDIDPRIYELRLRAELKGIYRKWSTMPYVTLSISQQSWRVELKWEGDRCLFTDGWLAFMKESGLEAGDTLVLFDSPVKGPNYANAVICKGQDELLRSTDVDSPDFEKSFFKIVSKSVLEEGVVVVPREIKDVYGDKLKRFNKVQVVGKNWFAFYNVSSGYISNLGGMLQCFNIVQNETIVFTIDASNYLWLRIYQEDGKEIEYVSRMHSASAMTSKTWVQSVNWDENGTKEEQIEEETNTPAADSNYTVHLVADGEALKFVLVAWKIELHGDESNTMDVDAAIGSGVQESEPKQFRAKLKPSNGDKSTHGVYIPKYITPRNRMWQPGEQVTLTTGKGSWKVVIVLSNGAGRFSAGWNRFVADNNFKKSNNLLFSMNETTEGITFDVVK